MADYQDQEPLNINQTASEARKTFEAWREATRELKEAAKRVDQAAQDMWAAAEAAEAAWKNRAEDLQTETAWNDHASFRHWKAKAWHARPAARRALRAAEKTWSAVEG